MRDILLVDDNLSMLTLIEQRLKRRGYHVTVASDGISALELLHQNPHIQFVLSDWLMPGMSGIDLCQCLKSSNYSRYIFFVLLSGNDDQESIINGINAGADDFVAKETHIDELDARIKAGFRTLALHNEVLEKNTQLDTAYATIKQDLETAADLLKRLLPSEKKLTGVELNYVSIPSAQIGGDMLGYMQLDEEHVAFYLLDVSGHGVPSALMSFSVYQSLTVDKGMGTLTKMPLSDAPFYEVTPPHEVLSQLNTMYQSNDENLLYFTMVYAVLNVKTGILSYSCAGHPPPVWQHCSSKQAELIGQDSFVVGVFDFVEYETINIQLEKGDRIWVYSDGITEAEQGEQQFSEEGFKDAVMELEHHPTSIQTDMLVNRVKSWQQSDNFEDDVSVLVVEWKGFPEGEKRCNTTLSTTVNAQFFN